MDDIFQIKPLIAWLETQPADKDYTFADRNRCLLQQYFMARGYADIEVGGFTISIGKERFRITGEFDEVAAPTPHTFGAALARAQAAEKACGK